MEQNTTKVGATPENLAHDVFLHISHGGSTFEITLPPGNTIEQLKGILYGITSVPVDKQKLLWKGMKRSAIDIEDSGLKNGSKITLIGTPDKAIELMHQAEAEASRRTEIMRAREARGPTKVRDSSGALNQGAQFRFHRVEPHGTLPNPIQARNVLSRLSEDPAILKVMRSHQFSVGLLTELAPHEHPNLLGLNVNGGQSILLRIRTDAYDGFRSYAEVRRVLCHELTHNMYGGHGDDFKTLNSQLNREVAEYEQSVKAGSHTLSGTLAHDDRATNIQREAAVQAFVLGGEGNATPRSADDNREERRQRILTAAISRLEQEEKEIEDHCRG